MPSWVQHSWVLPDLDESLYPVLKVFAVLHPGESVLSSRSSSYCNSVTHGHTHSCELLCKQAGVIQHASACLPPLTGSWGPHQTAYSTEGRSEVPECLSHRAGVCPPSCCQAPSVPYYSPFPVGISLEPTTLHILPGHLQETQADAGFWGLSLPLLNVLPENGLLPYC